MSTYQVLALGAFIIAGAHYVRNGDDFWYVAWMASAITMVLIDQHMPRPVSSDHRVKP